MTIEAVRKIVRENKETRNCYGEVAWIVPQSERLCTTNFMLACKLWKEAIERGY